MSKMIDEFEGYELYSDGRVFSHKNNIFLKTRIDGSGYEYVRLSNKKHYLKKIHRLVAEHFLTKQVGKNIVNHKDGNKLNNSVNNLEWCDNKYNSLHAHRLGLIRKTTKKVAMCDADGNVIKTFNSVTQASKETNSNKSNISSCCRGFKYKKVNGYVWKYL